MSRANFRPTFDTLEGRLCLTDIGFAVRPITYGELFPASASAPDLNGDGLPDILFHLEESFAWYKNVGGQFESGGLVGGGDDALQAVAVDIDGDGDLDVATASEEHAILAWFDNVDGRGTFQGSDATFGNVVFEMSGHDGYFRSSRGMAVGDIDGDGDVDLVGSYTGERSGIAWFENTNGAGAFGSQQAIEFSDMKPGFAPNSLSLSDIDGDGDLDLLAVSRTDNTLAWFQNADGRGSFGERQVLGTDAAALAADLDADGDLDVVAASGLDDTIAWYSNLDGRGQFGSRTEIASAAGGVRSMDVADIDGDGDLDLLTANWSPGRQADRSMKWYEHLDGQGSFATGRLIAAIQTDTTSVHAADLDQDGDLDILMSHVDPVGERDDAVVYFEQRRLGDVNDDGRFDSSDLIAVLQAGHYQDAVPKNSAFEEGDWNGDGEFDSADLVLAFQAGHYVTAAHPTAK